MSTYPAFAAALVDGGVLSDPWLAGEPRFAAPRCVPAARAAALVDAAEAIAAVHEELARLVAAEPAWLDSFFQLTPWQRGMALAALPDWHGIARADVFWTAHGAQVCELNSDTPSGQAEAVLANAAALAGAAGQANTRAADARGHDANQGLPARFVALVEHAAAALGHRGSLQIGMLYPTEMPEDLSMVAAYQRWLEAAGHRLVLGAPFNLGTAADGRASLFDRPCDVVLRHYKTDWWGERLPVRDDEPAVEDAAPLAEPLLHLLQANVEGRTAVVNPFGAVLTQNKRALAFCWEQLHLFSTAAQAAIRRHLPETVRLERIREQLWQQRQGWVLKSDYGCEGAEVVVGPHVDQATWEDALQHAIATRWVAQRAFVPLPEADGAVTNYGVYLIAGRAAGLLLREHGAGPTDATARIAPAFVAGGGAA